MEHVKQQLQLKCQVHKDYDIIYLQVNEVNEKNKPFYCEVCVSADFDFKASNYIRFKSIQQSLVDNSIIPSWPPLENKEIQRQLLLISKNNQQSSTLCQDSLQIAQFFDDLKQQALPKLNECQKGALKVSEQIETKNENIKAKYNEVSQVIELKDIINNKSFSLAQKEILCKKFINQITSQKNEYTKEFLDIFKEQRVKSDSELSGIKEKILGDINQISFFASTNTKESIEEEVKGEEIDFVADMEFIAQPLFPHFNTMKIRKDTDQKQIVFTNSFDLTYKYGCKFYYTNTIFQKNKKYELTFKVRTLATYSTSVQIGFVNDATKDSQDNMLGFVFSVKDNKLTLEPSYNSCKIVKGDFDQLSTSNIDLQVTLHADEGIMEMVDLPEKKHKAVISDQKYIYLKQYELFRLFISILDDVELTLISINSY